MKKNHLLTLLLFFTAFLFLFQLNATHLTSWDEAWHAVMSRDMARSGDFVTPVYNGRIWFATAPLYLWIVGIWFQLTDYSLIGVRLFSALSGIGTVFLVYLIGKELKNKFVGLIAALILTTTIHFLFRGRQGNLDVPLAFFNTLAVYSYLKGTKNPRWFIGIGIATALGFLTKSILGLFPIILLFLIPLKFSLLSLLAFLTIAAPWHIAAYSLHGMKFVNHYFFQYVLSKATNANPVSGTEIFWYVSVLKHGLKVWFILLWPALGWVSIQLLRHSGPLRHSFSAASKGVLLALSGINTKQSPLQPLKDQEDNKMRLYLIPLIWSVFPFILLTIAKMRNDWYIISLYPGIALLIAVFIQDVIDKTKIKTLFTILSSVLIIFLALANVTKYKSSFVVPETVAAEVTLATRAQNETSVDETIILDDNYLPVALFYSDRPIYPVRYSRAFDSLVTDEGLQIATESARLVLTNTENQDQLLDRLHNPDYEVLETAGDKLLIRLTFGM